MSFLSPTAALLAFALGLLALWLGRRRDRARWSEVRRRLDLIEIRLAATAPAPAARSVKNRIDPAEEWASCGPTLITVPDLTAAAAPPADRPDDLAERFRTVLELADAGLAAAEIAAETGHPVGQIELVLGLRQALTAGRDHGRGGRRRGASRP